MYKYGNSAVNASTTFCYFRDLQRHDDVLYEGVPVDDAVGARRLPEDSNNEILGGGKLRPPGCRDPGS